MTSVLRACHRSKALIWRTPHKTWQRNARKATVIPDEQPDLAPGQLPPLHLWRRYFPIKGNDGTKQRVSVSNEQTAQKLVDSFISEDAKEKVVIEAFPGQSLYLLLCPLITERRGISQAPVSLPEHCSSFLLVDYASLLYWKITSHTCNS